MALSQHKMVLSVNEKHWKIPGTWKAKFIYVANALGISGRNHLQPPQWETKIKAWLKEDLFDRDLEKCPPSPAPLKENLQLSGGVATYFLIQLCLQRGNHTYFFLMLA